MGGSSSSSIPRFNWEFIRRDDYNQVYQNEYGALAEKHVVPNNPKLHEEEELETYYYRYNTTKPIVKVYRADYESGEEFCSNHKNITVFTEYIPYRLADVRSLNHEQGLFVLSEALLGYHELHYRVGNFSVQDTMIGFNKDGLVRVWFNANFAVNNFQLASLVLMSTVNPQEFDKRLVEKCNEEMVNDIWNAVDRKSLFRPEFRREVQMLQPKNFLNLKEVVDNEVRRQKYVPGRLRFEDKYEIIASSRARLSQDLSRSSYNRTSMSMALNPRVGVERGGVERGGGLERERNPIFSPTKQSYAGNYGQR